MHTLRYLLIIIIFFSPLQNCNGKTKPASKEFRLTILHTNDIHGHFFSERRVGWEERLGGAPILSSIIKGIKRKNKKENVLTLILDAGDFYSGTPEGNITKGRAILKIMEKLGYNAINIGNHEFDDGKENLKELIGLSKIPFLGANIIDKDKDSIFDGIRPYILFKAQIKIAVIGVTTPETEVTTLPQNIKGLRFEDPIETVKYYKEKIVEENGKSLFIILSHLGLEEDKKLAKAVKGLSVIIGGHSHNLLTQPIKIKDTIICQTGSYGRYLGKLDLWIDPDRLKIKRYRYRLIKIVEGSTTPDPEMVSLIKRIRENLGIDLERVISYAKVDIITNNDEESYLGDMITDAMREVTSAQIAFQNAHGIRYPLPKGEITIRDLFMVLPFNNTLVTMELTGEQIKEIVKLGLKREHGMLQVSGLKIKYRERDGEIELVSIKLSDTGEDIRDDKSYRVVTNNFLAQGGDGMYIFLQGKNIKDTGLLLRNIVVDYLQKKIPLDPTNFKPNRIIQIP